ncbi:cupin domain-containing protein [Terrihabitans sp. B22-R8]|uniref:cupin domain-containing protein n=1 Tax=Terrihabitans sp. B22-R8 TaxID=3425128 RepID=UPI00403C15A1
MSAPLHLPTLLTHGFETADYEPFREGVEICHIQRPDNGDGPALALLRYQPGAAVPRHEHTGLETICVLRGSQSDESGTYRTGDVVLNPPGSVHSVWSDEGCVVLISWAAPVRILDDSEPASAESLHS